MIPKRKIGPVLATVLVANNMIGSGILLLPASLGATGSITILSWIAGTAGALVTAWVLARLGQKYPRPAGPCAYAADAMGPFMGFQATFLYWISCWVGCIVIALAAVGYLASFFPALAEPSHAALAVIACLWIFTALNILGPRIVCQVNSLGLFVGLVPILFVAIAGWRYFDPSVFANSWNVSGHSPLQAVTSTLAPVFWAFLGFESASMAIGVIDRPERNAPLATIAGVSIASIVYIVSCTVIMGILPAEALSRSTAPFADAMRLAIGPVAGGLIAICAIFKALGTLGGWILIAAETGRAGADRRVFPSAFGLTNRAGIPVFNFLILGAITTAGTFLTISPSLRQQFDQLVDMCVILNLLTYVFACISVWHFRLKEVHWAAALAIPFCLFVISQSGTNLIALAAGLVFLSVALYPFVLSWRSDQS